MRVKRSERRGNGGKRMRRGGGTERGMTSGRGRRRLQLGTTRIDIIAAAVVVATLTSEDSEAIEITTTRSGDRAEVMTITRIVDAAVAMTRGIIAVDVRLRLVAAAIDTRMIDRRGILVKTGDDRTLLLLHRDLLLLLAEHPFPPHHPLDLPLSTSTLLQHTPEEMHHHELHVSLKWPPTPNSIPHLASYLSKSDVQMRKSN